MEWRRPERGGTQQGVSCEAHGMAATRERQTKQPTAERGPPCEQVRRVRLAAKDRFLERYVEEIEEEVCKHNQWGYFQCLKSLRIEDTRKVDSQFIRDEEGGLLRDPSQILECGRGISATC